MKRNRLILIALFIAGCGGTGATSRMVPGRVYPPTQNVQVFDVTPSQPFDVIGYVETDQTLQQFDRNGNLMPYTYPSPPDDEDNLRCMVNEAKARGADGLINVQLREFNVHYGIITGNRTEYNIAKAVMIKFKSNE